MPLQGANPTPSFGGFGLSRTDKYCSRDNEYFDDSRLEHEYNPGTPVHCGVLAM